VRVGEPVTLIPEITVPGRRQGRCVCAKTVGMPLRNEGLPEIGTGVERAMPEITRRRTAELLRKLFEILLQHPDGMAARDALATLEAAVQLTEYEGGTYESGQRRFDQIVRFATVDTVKAGWLLKDKGRWTVTEAGRQAFTSHPDPDVFYRRAAQLYRAWKASLPDSPETPEGETDAVTEKTVSVTFEQAEEQAWSEIEQYLRRMNPYEFQELVADLLRAMGYHVSWVAPPGKDGGVDILAHTDPLGTRPPRIKVQVKRQGQSVNCDGLRSFMAVLGSDDVGLFVSTGGFTKDAADEARTQHTRKITLLTLEALFDLWVEHYSRLSDTARRRLPLRPIHFLEPSS
jgi:restriction system protein